MRYILITKESYSYLVSGFINGSDMLSAANPANSGRDLRPGLNGGIIARAERSINRKLKALSHERELTDTELEEYGLMYFKQHGTAPSIEHVEKLQKPRELNEDPCWLELTIDEHERFMLYYSNAKWFITASEIAANVLDMIETAPDTKVDFKAMIDGVV